MSVVYELSFIRQYEHRGDTELRIGTYAKRSDAEAAIGTLKDKPGFSDYPEGFQIVEAELGQTGWECGFITRRGPPPKDAAGEAFDLPSYIDD